MRNIEKRRAPQSLLEYKKTPGADFGGLGKLPAKEELKRSLLEEQGSICCYCMRRITLSNMKVEHWESRRKTPQLQLEYGNLLAACKGNEDKSESSSTCDTCKKDKVLSFNPANPAHDVESKISYSGEGRIFARYDQTLNEELETVLNLNDPQLMNNRRDVVDAVHDMLAARAGQRNKTQIRKLLLCAETRDSNGNFSEYLGVTTYFLKKYERAAPN